MSNTFGKEITATFYGENANGFVAVEQAWKEYQVKVTSGKATLEAAHYLVYAALRGKDWTKGFTPETKGGYVRYDSAKDALRYVHNARPEYLLAPFGGVISAEGLQALRAALPQEFPETEALKVWSLKQTKSLIKRQESLATRIVELEAEEESPYRNSKVNSLKSFLALTQAKLGVALECV